MTETKQFKAGDSPADYNVQQVVAYLKSDDATPDEYDRIMQAEREGQGRVGILNLTGDESVTPPAPPAAPDLPKAEVSNLPPSVVDPDAEKEDQAPESATPLSAADSIAATMARLDARKGRNYEDVLSTRGDRPHGE